jgi:thymidylate kinase
MTEDPTRVASIPLYTVAVEGPDGAGKTSLIQGLRGAFDLIEPAKSSAFQLMPKPLRERIAWFREEDPFVTSRIYMQAHGLRYRVAAEYAAKRIHYRTAKVNRFNAPVVCMFDRGPLSMSAYTYAMLKVDTTLSDEVLHSFIHLQEQSSGYESPMMTILLLPKNENAANLLLSRLSSAPDNAEREVNLISHQLSYFKQFSQYILESGRPVLQLDPFDPQETNMERARSFIVERLNECLAVNRSSLKEHSNISGSKIYLSDILQRLRRVSLTGRVYLVGGIVEKGYSDNDADLLVENEADVALLTKVLDCKQNHIHIDIAVSIDEELKEGKNVWNLLVPRYQQF